MPGADRPYLADGVFDLVAALLNVARAGSGHNRQDYFVDGGLMELEGYDAVAAIHQVSEKFSMNDAAIGKDEVVAGAGDVETHQRKIVAAGTKFLRGQKVST